MGASRWSGKTFNIRKNMTSEEQSKRFYEYQKSFYEDKLSDPDGTKKKLYNAMPKGTLYELYDAIPVEKKEPLKELLFRMIDDTPTERPDIPTLLDILDKIM